MKLDNINFKYTPAAKTNILDTLKRFGWYPPSQNPKVQEKWARYRNALAINDTKPS